MFIRYKLYICKTKMEKSDFFSLIYKNRKIIKNMKQVVSISIFKSHKWFISHNGTGLPHREHIM